MKEQRNTFFSSEKKTYASPSLNVILLNTQDVLTGSGDSQVEWGSGWGDFTPSRENTHLGD